LSIRAQMGNSKLNEEHHEICARRQEFKDIYDAKIHDICVSEEFKKSKAKLTKDIDKKITKLYRKTVKKYGKMVANVLFDAAIPEVVTAEVGIYQNKMKKTSKKMVKLNKELDEKLAEINEDRKLVAKELEQLIENCPKVTSADLSITDQSSIIGHKKVQLPGDSLDTRDTRDTRDMSGVISREEDISDSLEGLEIEDLKIT